MRHPHLLVLLLLPFFSYAIHSPPVIVQDTSQYVQFFDEVQLSPTEFMNYRPVDHRRIGGRRLGWWRTIVLKKAQKALRRQAGPYTVEQVNTQLENTKKRYPKSSFYLATLFPIIGLLIALGSGKLNRIRAALWGAWLGLAVRLLIVAFLVLTMIWLISFFSMHLGP